MQWTLQQPIPGVTLSWRLLCGEAQLASGELAMPAEGGPGVIRLVVPGVRVRTAMQLVYRAQQAGKQAVLAQGTAAIEVYPADLLAGAAGAWRPSPCWYGTCRTMLRTVPGCRPC